MKAFLVLADAAVNNHDGTVGILRANTNRFIAKPTQPSAVPVLGFKGAAVLFLDGEPGEIRGKIPCKLWYGKDDKQLEEVPFEMQTPAAGEGGSFVINFEVPFAGIGKYEIGVSFLNTRVVKIFEGVEERKNAN